MLYREIPMTKQKSIHPAEELPDRYYLIWIVLINLMHSTFSLRLLEKIHGTLHLMIILEKNMILMLYCFRFSIQQMEKLLQLTLAKMVIW